MYHFIINPNSRTGTGIRIWQELVPLLAGQDVPYKEYMTRGTGDASNIARNITADEKAHIIIIVGGDGTINEVIQGIIHPEKITLGYIPTGSSNDFARSFAIPTEPQKALDMILHPKHFTQLDIGVLRYQDQSRRFCVSAGIGFDASICHEALHSRLKERLNRLGLGKLTYACIAVKQLFLYKPGNIVVTLDGQQTKAYEKVYFASVMNQPYEGGGLKMAPEARADDGFLDVMIVEHYARPVILCMLPTAFFGLHTKFRHVHVHRCQRVTIQRNHPGHVHTDGESCQTQKEIEAFCLPEKIKVITG